MGGNWVIEAGVYGPRIVMKGPWSSAAHQAVKESGVKEVELNYAKGWKGPDYGFLRQLSNVESLELTDWTAKDVGPVNAMTSVRRLKVFTYCKTELRFSQFPLLEECSLEWRPKAASLFEHRGVKKLFINKYPGKDLSALKEMTSLESLSLASPRIETLQGIRALGRLTFFGVYVARHLTTLDGLDGLTGLVHVEVNDCRKLRDISPLGYLRALKELHLCNDGEVETMKPLAGLEDLEKFLFYESTNVLDGDLSPLKNLPRLQHVAFMDRKHYSHRRGDFPLVRVS